jgi:RNA polymerase sigma factor (sigma-70 family)
VSAGTGSGCGGGDRDHPGLPTAGYPVVGGNVYPLEPRDIAQLVRSAAEGDRRAWERLHDQYSRIIWSITRSFRLTDSDAADVFQVTWLRLLEHIDRLNFPDRVGSWLASTARHECLRIAEARQRIVLVHDHGEFGEVAHEPAIDERLLAEERADAVREALARLPWRHQRLLNLLMADPPASYAEISDQLGLPVGSIGPTRGRCLERLRVLLEAS